ncbi:MAG: hypothetical protein IPJ61_05340 [Tessaracoccus sp.]|nr:hypothetical protein [Tessaracoccus sp.]
MTEFNRRVSAVTRKVIESGEPLQVTNRGRVVLRLVPESQTSEDPLEALVAAGLATAAVAPRRRLRRREPVPLSLGVDELLDEVNADAEF